MYNPSLCELVGGMTDDFGGSYIAEYVYNGPKNYAYHTGDGKQVSMLTFDVMKEIAISEQEKKIIVTESRKLENICKYVKLTHCHSQSCIRECLTRECATLTTTTVYRTDMPIHYIYIYIYEAVTLSNRSSLHIGSEWAI